MTSSTFEQVEKEFPLLFNLGQSAEFSLYQDPAVCLIKLWQFGQKLTGLLFEKHLLAFPYDNSFHNRIKTLEFEKVLPYTIKDLFFHIKEKGNLATHQNKGTVDDGKGALLSAFKISKWFYETYSHANNDIGDLRFHPPAQVDTRHALHELEQQYQELEKKFKQLLEERNTGGLPEEKKTHIQERSQKASSKIELSEAETRELIDAQLRKAGWEMDTKYLNYKGTDAIEAQYPSLKEKIEKLPQALLAKAFRGELVLRMSRMSQPVCCWKE